MDPKQLVDRLLAGEDVRKTLTENETLNEGVSLLALAKWLLGQCDMSVESEMPQEEHIASLVDALQHTPEVVKYYMQNAMDNKPVYEAANPSDIRVALFMQAINGLIKALNQVQSVWKDVRQTYPDFDEIVGQKYPFAKSVDQVANDTEEWQAAVRKCLLGE